VYTSQNIALNLLASRWSSEVKLPGAKGRLLFATITRIALDKSSLLSNDQWVRVAAAWNKEILFMSMRGMWVLIYSYSTLPTPPHNIPET
jgi:hypothetical protein